MRIPLLLLATLFFVQCGADPEPISVEPPRPLRPYTFTVTVPDHSAKVADALRSGLNEAVERVEAGFGEITIDWQPVATAEEQRAVLNEALASEVEGVAVWALDGQALVAELQQLKAAGIPVLGLNKELPGALQDAFYGPHEAMVGARLAEMAAESPPAIVGVVVDDEVGSAQQLDAFMSRIGETEAVIAGMMMTRADPDASADAVVQLFNQTPEINRLVFIGQWPFANPAGGVGLNVSARSEVFAQGEELEVRSSLQAGELTRAVVWRARNMGQEAIGLLLALCVQERTVPARVRARLGVMDRSGALRGDG